MTQYFSTFFAGFLASLTPCVYPMIPITLGYFGKRENSGVSNHHASHPARQHQSSQVFFYLIGQVIAFTILGTLAVSLGEAFGFSSESTVLNVGAGVLFLILGVASFYSKLPNFLNRGSDFIQKLFQRQNSKSLDSKRSFLSQAIPPLALGVSSAIVASPCSTPVLGGVLSMISTQESYFAGVALMLTYSLGFCLVFSLLGFGLLKMKSIPRSGQWLVWMHHLSSAALTGCGVYYLGKGLNYF